MAGDKCNAVGAAAELYSGILRPFVEVSKEDSKQGTFHSLFVHILAGIMSQHVDLLVSGKSVKPKAILSMCKLGETVLSV